MTFSPAQMRAMAVRAESAASEDLTGVYADTAAMLIQGADALEILESHRGQSGALSDQLQAEAKTIAVHIVESIPSALGATPDPWPRGLLDPNSEPCRSVACVVQRALELQLHRIEEIEREWESALSREASTFAELKERRQTIRERDHQLEMARDAVASALVWLEPDCDAMPAVRALKAEIARLQQLIPKRADAD